MELLVVRHAEPRRVEVAEGPADPSLTDRGREQAERLTAFLADEAIDAVVSSPLARARETAAPVASSHGVVVDIVDGLAEWDAASSYYIPMEELRATKDERWQAMVEGRWHEVGSEAVDPDAFRRGVIDAFEELIAGSRSKRVVVVCHGGVINLYLGHVLGLPRPMWFEPLYAAVSRVAAHASGIRSVISLNEAGHLRGVLPPPILLTDPTAD